MGSTFSYQCFSQPHLTPEEASKLFEQAHDEVLRIKNTYTEFSESIINDINLNAGKKWTSLDDEAYFLLKKGIEFSKITNGLFSLSISTISYPWKVKFKKGEVLSKSERVKLLEYVDDTLIQFNDLKKEVLLSHEQMRIGLGGLGKGYAVDCAFQFLKSKGMINFCVNGGGDLRVHSHIDAPRPWKIGITNPFSEKQKYVGWVKLTNEALSTSGSYRQKNTEEDHHIIHPKLGISEKIIKSVSLICESTMQADAFCTAIMNMQWNEAINWMNKMQLKGVIIHRDGKTYSKGH